MTAASTHATSKLVRQFDAVAGSRLPVGHTVHGAVRVNLTSAVAATAAESVLGGIGAVASAAALEHEGRVASDAGFPTDPQQALGVTDEHLVVCSRSSLSGRPKSFLTTIPLNAFATVDFATGFLGDRLTFTMRSGTQVEFSCVKVDAGADFAAVVTERLSAVE